MIPILSILFPINFLICLYMAYRLIKMEERNAVFLPLIGAFLSNAILTFQEFQILHVELKVVIEHFTISHIINAIWILLLALFSSIAFLYPKKKHQDRAKLLYTIATIPAIILFGAIVFYNNLEHVDIQLINGIWHYKLVCSNFIGGLFLCFTFLAGILISCCYWVQYFKLQDGQKNRLKIPLLVMQTTITLGACIAFVYLAQYYHTPYAVSIPITFSAIALTKILTNFNLGKINSSLALNDILYSMSNILIITNKNLEIVEINNEGLKILKMTREELEGKPIFNLIRLFNIDNWKELARIIIQSSAERSIDKTLTLHHKDEDEYQYINLSVKPHHDKKNVIAGYIFIGTDVTEVHEQQISIQEHSNNLERTNKELERFAYIASHDLKTPLRSVVSFLDLIERRIVKYNDKDLKEFVYLARQGASTMYHLIQDILEFSRVDKVQEKKKSIDLNETVFNICHTLQPTIREKNGEILVSNLPEVKAEKTHMTQLFTNLIENGFKYNDGKHPIVKVNHREENGRHLFAVSDNGIGVEQQYYDQIFEMFKRLHTNPDHEGSGIGLSICKKIVDIYKGEIWLESKVNEGTTFFFTINNN